MKTLENLKYLIGEEFENVIDDIICSFEEEGDIIVKDSENNGYDKIAYIDNANSTQYLFKLEDGKIVEVWEA